MNSKSLLIAIAAFAVTATGAQAYTSINHLSRAGLNETQVVALGMAHELRMKGKVEEARDVLLEAGIDEDTIDSLRQAAREAHEALLKAIEDNDYDAFKLAVEGTPLYDLITSEEDFELFVEAHGLKLSGQYAKAKTIFDDLGITAREMHGVGGYGRGFKPHHRLSDLSEEEREALAVARQANDKTAVREILVAAGIEQREMKRDWSRDWSLE